MDQRNQMNQYFYLFCVLLRDNGFLNNIENCYCGLSMYHRTLVMILNLLISMGFLLDFDIYLYDESLLAVVLFVAYCCLMMYRSNDGGL